MWFVLALLSAVFAALTSILAKVGIEGVNSNLATAIRTMVVLVTDLYEGGGYHRLYQVSSGIIESGAKLIVLPALDHDAVPNYDKRAAATLADMGASVGAMTPEELSGFIAKIL